MPPDAECDFDGRRPYVIVKASCGPVAQLGARFHGMEEVDGSNPSRSTIAFEHLPLPAGKYHRSSRPAIGCNRRPEKAAEGIAAPVIQTEQANCKR
jgi:hypothetical protein